MGLGGEIKHSQHLHFLHAVITQHDMLLLQGRESEEQIFGKSNSTVIYSCGLTDMFRKLLVVQVAASRRTNGHGLNAAILRLHGFEMLLYSKNY